MDFGYFIMFYSQQICFPDSSGDNRVCMMLGPIWKLNIHVASDAARKANT